MQINLASLWENNKPQTPVNIAHTFYRFKTPFRYSNEHESTEFIYIYSPTTSSLNLKEVKLIIEYLHSIPLEKHTEKPAFPVYLNLDDCTFTDKITYVMLESVLYYLSNIKEWYVFVSTDFKEENCTSGIIFSSLNYTSQGNERLPCRQDISPSSLQMLCEDREHQYKSHRGYEEATKESCLSSVRYCFSATYNKTTISSDIYDFFEQSSLLSSVDSQTFTEIISTILEIKDNCEEHIQCPYIYDIDIKKACHSDNSPLKGKPYISINVAIWDFSNLRLGDAIKEKFEIIGQEGYTQEQWNEQVGGKTGPYTKLCKAYRIHSSLFGEKYREDDFFALAAFQPGITGRKKPEFTGGAGLTKVLDFLIDYQDHYKCYCLTGDTYINLGKEYLNKTDKWFSFNPDEFSDFLETKPSDDCIHKSDIYYPGTAFFLHLEIN